MAIAERQPGSANPLVEGLERLPVPPTTLTIFGATGDLARRKLLPALYNLAHDGALPERFNLVGIARKEMSDEEFQAFAREAITTFSRRETDPDVLEGLLSRLRYVGFPFDNPDGHARLRQAIEQLDTNAGLVVNCVYYLSTATEYFGTTMASLKAARVNWHCNAEVRVTVE